MDAPLSPDHAFDFFVAEPVSRLTESPNNQNGWIEWDVPLGGEIDESMENPGFDEEKELDEFMDDDEDVLDKDEEWLMTPMMPPKDIVTVLSTYEDENLEYRHGELVKKMVKVSDAEVADSITIGEIHPRVATVEEQVESKVDTYLSGQMAVPGHDMIVGLSQQVQTLQKAVHEAELQNQLLRNRVAEMESHDGILISYMLWMEERLTVLEKRLMGPPSGTQ
nr:hypothetical protein [Tanacetum cinerariifolium]